MSRRTNLLVAFLIVVIIILVGIMTFSFLIEPAFTGHVVDKQIEAQNILLQNMALMVRQNGFVQIPVEDQVLVCTFAPENTNPQE
jgi:hypothetical protein